MGMALRERTRVLHSQLIVVLHKARQQQFVQIQVCNLSKHGYTPFLGQVQEVGTDTVKSVFYRDMHQDRTVGNMKFSTIRIAILRPEVRIQVIQQTVESLQILALVIQIHALFVSLRMNGTLRGVHYGRNKCKCLFHVIIWF